MVNHHIRVPHYLTVAEDMREVIFLVTTKIARLRFNNVREFFATPRHRMPGNVRKPGSSGDSIVDYMEVVKNCIVRDPVRYLTMIANNHGRLPAVKAPFLQRFLVIVQWGKSVRHRACDEQINLALRLPNKDFLFKIIVVFDPANSDSSVG
jgi:hypothetical protein